MIDLTSYRNNRTAVARSTPGEVPSPPMASVIIPAYNEELGLAAVLDQLLATVGDRFEIIVVDDGSADGTSAVASHYPCRLITHERNQGKGSAMRTGAQAATADNIIFIDADDSYPVEAIPMVAERLQHADFVVGCREDGREHIPHLNQLGNRAIATLIQVLYGFRESDPLSGLYGIKREYFFKMNLRSPGFAIEAEIALKAARMGLKTDSFPILYKERIGDSKLSAVQDGYRIGKTILSMLTLYNPTILFVVPGTALFSLATLAVLILSFGPVSIGPILFSTNSLLAFGMLSLAGFELATFGIALHIYGTLHKFTRPDAFGTAMFRIFSSSWLLVVSASAILSSLSLSAAMFVTWSTDNFGPFEHTTTLFVGAFMGILGLQLMLSALFLSPLLEDLRLSRDAGRLPTGQLAPVASVERRTALHIEPEEQARAA